MRTVRSRAALGALAALLLALLAPAAPTDRATTGLRLAAVEQCAAPAGRVAPRSPEHAPSAPLPSATAASAVAVEAPHGTAGHATRAHVTTYTSRGAACVRGPPGD